MRNSLSRRLGKEISRLYRNTIIIKMQCSASLQNQKKLFLLGMAVKTGAVSARRHTVYIHIKFPAACRLPQGTGTKANFVPPYGILRQIINMIQFFKCPILCWFIFQLISPSFFPHKSQRTYSIVLFRKLLVLPASSYVPPVIPSHDSDTVCHFFKYLFSGKSAPGTAEAQRWDFYASQSSHMQCLFPHINNYG